MATARCREPARPPASIRRTYMPISCANLLFNVFAHEIKPGTPTSPDRPRLPSLPRSPPPFDCHLAGLRRASPANPCIGDPETVGNPQYDYGVDDQSFAAELPDDGAQEPAATTVDGYLYSDSGYFYVHDADGQE
ncbi:uncharacterized protein [Triticum aestivum]|uniref:uncharacterized protein isoform X1 n=1 Tax=Triticum aestivum TaxID=4565 RepID=UPI001D0039E6|nr:uncharacterized protein LOC123089851 isoform X1 [Triticum aestivum]